MRVESPDPSVTQLQPAQLLPVEAAIPCPSAHVAEAPAARTGLPVIMVYELRHYDSYFEKRYFDPGQRAYA
jgi:hypothetical protein